MPDSLTQLAELFYTSLEELGQFTPVTAQQLPTAYQSLLAHNDHMTVTVEAWHNSLVDLQVLEQRRDADSYARKILLALQRDLRPVQLGIMRIQLTHLPEIVRQEIESETLPLGRILIRHHVLRAVELCQLWKITPGAALQAHLRLASDDPIFGRTARILVAGCPVVELLEIVKT
jgi:chorismate-pyruvate lyase